jgi:hypothetical protein
MFFCVGGTILAFLILDFDIPYTACAMAMSYSVLCGNAFNELFKFLSGAEQRMISVERVRQYYKNEIEHIDRPLEVIF